MPGGGLHAGRFRVWSFATGTDRRPRNGPENATTESACHHQPKRTRALGGVAREAGRPVAWPTCPAQETPATRAGTPGSRLGPP